MTTRSLCRAICFAACLAISSSLSAADQDKKPPQKIDPAKLEKLFEQYANPGKEHKALRRLVGKWNTSMKDYFGAEPGKSPTVEKGTANIEAILGGRYIRQTFVGTHKGKKFSGQGIMGFDNSTKKYVSVWIDNMSTGIMVSQGTYDPKAHTLTEHAEMDSPIGKMKIKMVHNYLTTDKYTITMYMLSEAAPQKLMEVTYTRAK